MTELYPATVIDGERFHVIKCIDPYFDDVYSNKKLFEARKWDRDYQVGDILHLKQYDKFYKEYTGREVYRVITYILTGECAPEGLCVMGVDTPFTKTHASVADYQRALQDVTRLTRAIDVAMHGEEGAAPQAALCDLVGPAADLRKKCEEAVAVGNRIARQRDSYLGLALDKIEQHKARCAALEKELSDVVNAASKPAPIDMILHCPRCLMQHIDGKEAYSIPSAGGGALVPPLEEKVTWDNPPHRSHLCHGCGHIWRPADVPTNGVRAIKTCGSADHPIFNPEASK